MYALILAGGSGTRLWPVSRQNSPKQTQVFFEDQTLLRKTYERLLKIFPADHIYVSTTKELAPLVLEQLPGFPSSRLIIEPESKNTAAAIALAAWRLDQLDPEASMMTFNSDHFIKDEAEFARAVKLAQETLLKYPQKTLLLGVKASYPETGYGYIKAGQAVGENLYQVDRFVEKPDVEMAKRYVTSGQYLWNPAYFVWRVDYLLKLIAEHLPEHSALLNKLTAAPSVLEDEFKNLPNISIDYGLMEKLTDLLVVAADFDWTDIGHWRAVSDALSKTPDENVVRGKHLGHDSHGNLIYSQSGKLVATVGVNDLIVVETDDAILICPKDRAQEVKKIVEMLKEKGHQRYL